VSIRHPSITSTQIVSKLRQQNISAAARQGWVRLSPHFYITPQQIERVLRDLPAV
jgi:selenocysteine lyase/cysteine desulfurase